MWLIYKVVEKVALEASSGELPFNWRYILFVSKPFLKY